MSPGIVPEAMALLVNKTTPKMLKETNLSHYQMIRQLVEKFNLKNYKREGPFKKYHDNGKLLMKGNYKNGKLDGPFENYWHNGKLSDKGIYKNGKRS